MSIFFDNLVSVPDTGGMTLPAGTRTAASDGNTQMTDGTDRAIRTRHSVDVATTVETLASRALGVLASKRTTAASLLSERFLDELGRAVTRLDGSGRETVIKEMLAAHIRREDIADFYIPEVARRLGAAWCEDAMSFTDVTIGVARLQGLLKDVGAAWFSDPGIDPGAPGLLVVVLADEFHTLGAMVMCGQLARLGVSVRLAVGHRDSEIPGIVASGQFDAIFISVSQDERVATLRKLVERIRAASVRPTPVVIGGSVVTRVNDIKSKTGADHATTDPREAMRACGLTALVTGARLRATSE